MQFPVLAVAWRAGNKVNADGLADRGPLNTELA